MPITLGILAQSREVVAASDFVLLETQVLGSSAASVTFAGLSAYAGTYKHLQIRASTRTDRSGADSDPVILQFNADTGANYTRHGLVGYNFGGTSAVYSNAATSTTSIMLTEATTVSSSTGSAFGAFVTDILDAYITTKNTTVRTLAGTNAAWSSVELRSGAFLNTAAISSILMKPLVGANFVQHSRFSIYGIRG